MLELYFHLIYKMVQCLSVSHNYNDCEVFLISKDVKSCTDHLKEVHCTQCKQILFKVQIIFLELYDNLTITKLSLPV